MKQGPIKKTIKILLIVLVLRPLVWLLLGVNRFSHLKVPLEGPMIIAPNHNSHLDTLLFYAILPLKVAVRTRVIAAGDYFGNIPIVSWFLFSFCGMVPVYRPQAPKVEEGKKIKTSKSPLESMGEALSEGDVLLLYPEGTRGKPQERSALRKGIVYLACSFPEVPIYPVFVKGLGKALPRDSFILIPLIPVIEIQDPIFAKDKTQRMVLEELENAYSGMERKVAPQDRREK
ncbi:MAG: 1-acyl-sn-glycerol-3-phosphate acyltransferase [Chitinophagaceae bacterium]|nr:1-acyl-sn-glycerol-3-phosphate acyltransferase [Oligoflexus sp.]